MRLVLGYWKIRGLCQPIRYILEYTGTDYEEKFYHATKIPNYHQEFDAVKFKLGLPFPNLPYLIDGDLKITQSKAILKYIARKHNLIGNSENERIRIDVMEGVTEDLRSGFTDRLCYNPNFENLKKEYLDALPRKLEPISEYLSKNDWPAGNHVSYVDFSLYETLDHHRHLAPDMLQKFSSLEKYMTRFEKLPRISAYLSSPRFFKHPLNFVTAKFGNV